MSSDDDSTKATPTPVDSGDLAAILASGGKRGGGRRWLWRGLAAAAIIGAGYGYYLYSSEATAYTYTT